MKTIYAFALFTVLLCFAGCVENEMKEYENDPAIYFYWDSRLQHDSIHHSFFLLNSEIKQDTVWVRINTMGKLEPVDRPIAVVQTNTGKPGAAVPGVHYQAFDSPGIKELMVVRSNKWYALLPVVFLRDPSLDLTTVRLELEVVGNDYFRPGIDALRKFVLSTTTQAVKPGNWDTFWYRFFGPTWGSVKMRLIIDATGYKEWDLEPNDIYFTQYLRGLVIQKLEEYNLGHPDDPLREANGELVVFD